MGLGNAQYKTFNNTQRRGEPYVCPFFICAKHKTDWPTRRDGNPLVRKWAKKNVELSEPKASFRRSANEHTQRVGSVRRALTFFAYFFVLRQKND